MLSVPSCSLATCVSSLVRCLFRHFAHDLLFILIIAFWEVFVRFGYKSFTRYVIGQYFLPVCGLLFHLHNMVFQRSGILNIDQVQFIHFHFMDHAFGVEYQKSLPSSKSQIFSMFFSRNFTVVDFTFRTMIYVEFVSAMKGRYFVLVCILMLHCFNTIC